MEIITADTIEKCNQLFLAKDKKELDNFLFLSLISQGDLLEFINKKSNLLKGIKRNETTFRMLWVMMRSFKEYNVLIPLIKSNIIDLYESKWSQRMRSNRSLSQEAMMAYIKTEIKQTFLVEYVMNNLHNEGSEYEIKDHDLLLKTYKAFFAIIELMDEEINKVIAA